MPPETGDSVDILIWNPQQVLSAQPGLIDSYSDPSQKLDPLRVPPKCRRSGQSRLFGAGVTELVLGHRRKSSMAFFGGIEDSFKSMSWNFSQG